MIFVLIQSRVNVAMFIILIYVPLYVPLIQIVNCFFYFFHVIAVNDNF